MENEERQRLCGTWGSSMSTQPPRDAGASPAHGRQILAAAFRKLGLAAVIRNEISSISPACTGQMQQISRLRPSLFHGAQEPVWESSSVALLEDIVLGVWRYGAERLSLARHQTASSCRGRRRPSCQAARTARASPSAVLTARFSANWTQRAWQSAAAGKCLPD